MLPILSAVEMPIIITFTPFFLRFFVCSFSLLLFYSFFCLLLRWCASHFFFFFEGCFSLCFFFFCRLNSISRALSFGSIYMSCQRFSAPQPLSWHIKFLMLLSVIGVMMRSRSISRKYSFIVVIWLAGAMYKLEISKIALAHQPQYTPYKSIRAFTSQIWKKVDYLETIDVHCICFVEYVVSGFDVQVNESKKKRKKKIKKNVISSILSCLPILNAYQQYVHVSWVTCPIPW